MDDEVAEELTEALSYSARIMKALTEELRRFNDFMNGRTKEREEDGGY